MKKLQLSAALVLATASISSHALYTTNISTNGISVDAGAATSVSYLDYASTGAASNTGAAPGITLNVDGDWDFDFTDLNNVTFTGNIALGDYRTQTNVTGFPVIDGRQSFTGVNQAISGTGSYDEATNIFSYTLASAGANTSGASTATNTSASCENGKTSVFGQVCSTWASTTADYEGITLDFLFSEDRTSFSGTIDAIEQSGSGLTANTTTVSFLIAGASPVPVPAAAWLFGSALIGLVGVKRKK